MRTTIGGVAWAFILIVLIALTGWQFRAYRQQKKLVEHYCARVDSYHALLLQFPSLRDRHMRAVRDRAQSG